MEAYDRNLKILINEINNYFIEELGKQHKAEIIHIMDHFRMIIEDNHGLFLEKGDGLLFNQNKVDEWFEIKD